jgi:hypothetical protein
MDVAPKTTNKIYGIVLKKIFDLFRASLPQ